MRWVVNATPQPFYPRETPGTQCIGGWVGLRAGLNGINNYHYYFKTVILSTLFNANVNCCAYSGTAKTVLLKIFSVILTRLYEHEPFGMLSTLHDSVCKALQQQRRSDYWNEITNTQTHTHQRLWIGAEWPLLYTKFSKQ